MVPGQLAGGGGSYAPQARDVHCVWWLWLLGGKEGCLLLGAVVVVVVGCGTGPGSVN